MIFSRGKVRKTVPILAEGKELERVDTFCYLGIVFRYNNTFQAAMKYNIDKAKKALFKMETLLGKVDLEIETKLHLFDTMVLPILIYGCEVWGFEEIEQSVSRKTANGIFPGIRSRVGSFDSLFYKNRPLRGSVLFLL